MNALELAARYSFMPNKLKYCGPKDADQILFNYVIYKKNEKKVKEILEKFEAFSLYLNLIAEKNNKNKFDEDVVEAYWIGNDLLDNIHKNDIKALIKNDFTKKGLPKSIAISLAKNIPNNSTAHHSFHVMHIHSVTGKIKFIYSNIDKCRISFGMVKKIEKNKLMIEYKPIIVKNKIIIGEPVKKEISYDKKFLGKIALNDYVAVHWDYAVHKLSEVQRENLGRYTEQNINAINSL